MPSHDFGDKVRAVKTFPMFGMSQILVADRGGHVEQWEPVTQHRTFVGHMLGKTRALGVAAEYARAYFAASDEWGVAFLHADEKHDPFIAKTICAARADGRALLVGGGKDPALIIWDAKTGRRETLLTGHDGPVNAVCTVGDVVVSGSDDRTVRLWDATAGTELGRLEGHTDAVTAVCPFREGMLATGSKDRTVRLWEVSTGRCLLTIPVHYPVTACTPADGGLAVGLTAGLIMLDLPGHPL